MALQSSTFPGSRLRPYSSHRTSSLTRRWRARDPAIQRRLACTTGKPTASRLKSWSAVSDRPRTRPDRAGGAGPPPEVRRERAGQGRARLADRAVPGPVQEHAHHHPARRDGAVRAAGRDRRRGHHRRDRAVLRRAELRAGIPRRQCPQGAEEDAGAHDQGAARRRGDAHSVARARSRRHHAAGGRRPHAGGRAPGGDPLPQVRRGAAHGRVVSRREGLDAAAARRGGRRSPQCRLRRDHGDLRSGQGDRDEHGDEHGIRQDRRAGLRRERGGVAARKADRGDRSLAGADRARRLRRRDRGQHRAGMDGRSAQCRAGVDHDHVRHRARGGRGSGSAGGDRHRRARGRDARDGEAQRARAAHAGRGDARLHDGDLLRQDRHADQGRDDGAPRVRGRPLDRGQRGGIRSRRQLRSAARRRTTTRCG